MIINFLLGANGGGGGVSVETFNKFVQDQNTIDESQNEAIESKLDTDFVNISDEGIEKIKVITKNIEYNEWVKFTANEDSTIGYTLVDGAEADIEINKTGYSEDTEKWDGSTINLSSNEYVYVRNLKPSTEQSFKIYLQFNITGNVTLDGKCSVLKDATKSYGCWRLFSECSGIKSLNSDFFDFDNIAENGLGGIFFRCTLLEALPDLPVTELTTSAYSSMCNGCTNLKYVKCNATNLGPTSTTRTSALWLNGVSSTGVFYKNPNISIPERGTSTIPEGWVVKDWITDKTLEERVEDVEEDVTNLSEKVDELQLFKFPNATIIGEPTIQNGQISGFSTMSYLQFPFIVDLHNQQFQIDFCFTTATNVQTQQNILDSKFGLALAIKDGKGLMAISSDGQSWNIGNTQGSMNIESNTTYYARLTWDGIQYKTLLSTDGKTYTQDMVLVGTQAPHPTTIFIGGCDNLETGHEPHPFLGTINLNKASLTVRGNIIWEGMDDVGLATRLATDMSNLDDNGRNVINGMIDTKLGDIEDILKTI